MFASRGVNSFYKLFSPSKIFVDLLIPESVSVLPVAWQGRINKSFAEVYISTTTKDWDRRQAIQKLSFPIGAANDDAEVLVCWEFDRFDKIVDLAANKYCFTSVERAIGDVFHRHLQPNETVDSLLKSTMGNLPDKFIGVHVRETDEANQSKGNIPLESYINTVKQALKANPTMGLYLATDNANVIQEFRREFPGVYVLQKWLPKSGEPLHLAGDCPDREKATVDALVDILALAASSILVSRIDSSFGIMARALSRLPDSNQKTLCPFYEGRFARIKRRLSQIRSAH